MTQEHTVKQLFDLTGRKAVITGGGGFLGRQHALSLLEAGCHVTLWDISETMLCKAKEELSQTFEGFVSVLAVDITDTKAVQNAAKSIQSLDILINNAGMTVARGQEKFKKYFNSFEDYPLELWNLALNVNLTGTFIITQALAPLLLRSKHASIINIASDVGIVSPDLRIYEPNPAKNYDGVNFNTPLSYATSKAALIHMTKYWATYWAKSGIRVNALSPAGVFNNQDPKFVEALTEKIPMGRMAKPYEYKGAILFLASDASSFMTGSNLIIDGGRTAW